MDNFSEKIEPYVVDIILELQRCGYETYLVGGAVRDILMNRKPKDYDISTAAPPEKIRGIFGRKFTRIVGKRFKIVHLRHNGNILEISTFRKASDKNNQKELKHTSHPDKHRIITNDNEYGTSFEDAWRRDFTVNAIFYNLTNNEFVDYTEKGLPDLKNGIVRIIGNPFVRFAEDPVRILRALKLVGQYGFKLEMETEQAVTQMLEHIKLASISRLTLELEKILLKPYVGNIFQVFFDYGFLNFFLPNLSKNWNTKETELLIRLHNVRSKRILESGAPSLLSVSITLIGLPFVLKKLAVDNTGDFVPYISQQDKPIVKKIINELLEPYAFPKQIIVEAVDAIVFQYRIYNGIKVNRLLRHPSFKIIRELSFILNEYVWHRDDLNNFLLSCFKKNKGY